MRTSRVSKDTSKYFGRVSASPPRRTTRSLSRFSHAPTKDESATPDIEDAIPPPAKRRKKAVPTSAIKSEPADQESKDSVLPNAPLRNRKAARKITDPSTGETTTAPPSYWTEMYDAVKRMRAPGGKAYPAAVDTMGCERLADEAASPKDQRFHTLVALMLSSQTKDTVNAVAMRRLQTELPAYKKGAPVGLNLDNMLAVEPDVLNQMIWAVGFHNNKTKCAVRPTSATTRVTDQARYLKQTAEILRDKWNGDIPDTIEGLTSLPGVGPKMGYLCLSAAWDKTEGIGVDVHVHRITNLWGWNQTKNPEETRLALQSWLPQDRWRDINHMLVGLGQTVCLPVGRRCGECELGLDGLCKAAEKKKVFEGRKVLKTIKAEGAAVKTEVEEEVRIKEEVVNEDAAAPHPAAS